MLLLLITGVYSKNIFVFLKSHGFDELFFVSPSDVHNTRKILNWPKTDKLDAKVIQKTAIKFPENLTPFVPKDSFFESLREITRSRYHINILSDYSAEDIVNSLLMIYSI
ncbi:IS110 family transposase [Marinitoga aeolica]|uniref:Transposase n=1 Tax=Marinitoga aeolica TaxID=2809031 RepID=A0ABY8PMM7_9BACT|nr:transposase [Marinitoga aeolica]WGS63883.1 transposase [Marinitoga aeolica]